MSSAHNLSHSLCPCSVLKCHAEWTLSVQTCDRCISNETCQWTGRIWVGYFALLGAWQYKRAWALSDGSAYICGAFAAGCGWPRARLRSLGWAWKTSANRLCTAFSQARPLDTFPFHSTCVRTVASLHLVPPKVMLFVYYSTLHISK